MTPRKLEGVLYDVLKIKFEASLTLTYPVFQNFSQISAVTIFS